MGGLRLHQKRQRGKSSRAAKRKCRWNDLKSQRRRRRRGVWIPGLPPSVSSFPAVRCRT
ncbi:hypothetical protein [Subdoligranulum variabile]|uniref:hypothetical protein n=1 Tax=Subdoligranulum variabile TaxID=214851 RepID=UPI0034E9884F